MVDEAPNGLSLDEQVCFPFYEASNLLQRLYRPLLEPFNLTYAQYLVMLVLWEYDGTSEVTVGMIGARLGFETGILSPLLKRMEARGHVIRKRSKDDERRVIITLTQHGRSLRDKAQTIPEQLLRHSRLSESDTHRLRENAQNFTRCLRDMLRSRSV
ncbi:MarR family winged helix-turn-helix transcriptional regulator [Saccharibacter floricola]|uniref:OhrR family transcriptional regulator n=1 Tax=Saccharibacter floricola DSM 15669 TaxID=1123227 RepID=A0ABQ0NZ11_9PROT|nr:MarR family transcriptional regulator [Saccharibacter floricola]GBQ07037.1 OhrR family transcriptional regulator [Saccharibacter floricola DSM 15669]